MLGPAGDPPVRPICRTDSTIYVIEDVVFAERTAEALTDIRGVTEERRKTSALAGESTSQHTRERGMCSAHRVVQTVVLHEACAFDIVSQVTADRDVTGTFVQVVSPTA